MAESKIKLPRSSYEELCKIIKAYGAYQQPVSLDEISKATAMGRTNISANNAFLSYIEVIEGGRTKIATSKGRELSASLEHEIPERIEKAWRDIVEANEFLNKMAIAVKIRRTMEVSSVVSHIAYSAGEKKTAQVMTGARAVVDILRASGLLKEQDGQLLYIAPLKGDTIAMTQSTAELTIKPPVCLQVPTIEKPLSPDLMQGVAITIQINVQATPQDLDGLGQRIKNLFKALKQPDEPEENS